MAVEPLSGNSKVVVYNSDVNLDNKTARDNTQGVTVGNILALGAKVYEAEVGALFGNGGTSSYVVQNTLGFNPNWDPQEEGELVATNALFNSPNKVYVSATCKASVEQGQSIRFTTAEVNAGRVLLGQFTAAGSPTDSNEGFYIQIIVAEA